MVQPGTRRYQEESKDLARNQKGKIGNFSSIYVYKTEMMLEEVEESTAVVI
jgi:hypothetical protein